MSLLAIVAAFGVTALSIPFASWLAHRLGCVYEPRPDRWSDQPTPYLGGVAMVLGIATSSVFLSWPWWWSACGAMFVLGFVDDLRPLRARTKLIAQTATALVVVHFGVGFQHCTPWPLVDGALSVVWFVGVTNALNLLDNMDGLAGGVATVAFVCAGVCFAYMGAWDTCGVCACFAAGTAAFLRVNRHPARIFMGDCGSLVLGSALALCTFEIQRCALALSPSILLVVVPVADTSFVSFTRWASGRPISEGGRDHISHNLVYAGWRVSRAVDLLCCVALAGGLAAVFSMWMPQWSVLFCVLFGAGGLASLRWLVSKRSYAVAA